MPTVKRKKHKIDLPGLDLKAIPRKQLKRSVVIPNLRTGRHYELTLHPTKGYRKVRIQIEVDDD